MRLVILLWFCLLAGCATIPEECVGKVDEEECAAEIREYERVEYYWTVFLPKYVGCQNSGGIGVWRINSNHIKYKRAFDKKDFSQMSKMDLKNFYCVSTINDILF